MDGDGDLDLAASVAFEEGVAPGPARIYESVDGVLSSLPVWKSARVEHSFGMEFADIDQDGLLDLAVAMPGVPIFRAVLRDRGVISLPREPGWTASQAIRYPMFLDAGRLGASTGLVVSYSDYGASIGQSGGARAPSVSAAPAAGAGAGAAGTGGDAAGAGVGAASASSTRFEAYAPQLDPGPTWRSASLGWGAGVALADVSGDGWRRTLRCSRRRWSLRRRARASRRSRAACPRRRPASLSSAASGRPSASICWCV
ncbi:FG-GAP repeat domain-containing protein [Sorangium sp. So ce381]|uniref:FG-GAP repeat domain-containing protein n=1 Tax=Sorangium sp. So ce381 TaxID=3133307 RepID=UPI003F5BA275